MDDDDAILETEAKTKLSLPYQEEHSLTGHVGAVLVVRFNRSGEYCMTGGKDRIVRLWNPHKGLHIKEYKGIHGYEILDIKITGDSTRFASCGADKVVFLWDVGTGNTIARYRGHSERINTIAFNEDWSIMCSGSYDKTVRIWDLKSRSTKEMQALTEFNDSVSSLVVTDHEVIAGSVDGKLRTYDIRMGKLITDVIAQPVTHVSLSNDKNCLLMSCLDDTLRLFDKGSGELLNEYTGHKSANYKVESCLTNTDAHVVSGSEDSCIYFWNLVEANLVHTLKGHSKMVTTLDYHASEVCLVSGSSDGTVKVWK